LEKKAPFAPVRERNLNHDLPDHYHPHHRVFVSDYRCAAAKRQERRYRCCLRRHGQPDRIRSARSGDRPFESHNLVRCHFHGDVSHAIRLRVAANGEQFGAARNQVSAREDAAGHSCRSSAAARSARTNPKVAREIKKGRFKPSPFTFRCRLLNRSETS